MKKILLLAMCTVIGGFSNTAYSAQDFSFDLDSAINDADNAAGTAADSQPAAPTGSSAKAIYPTVDAQSYLTASPATYYDPALIESLITKYKQKNYVGCIQEAQAKMQQDNPNPVAMYYMALSYTQIGDVKAALDLYDAILKLKPSETLTECAVRGRDCLIGGSSCPNIGVEGAEIDAGVQEYRDNILNDSTTDLKQLPDLLVDSSKKKSAEPSVKEQEKISEQPAAVTPDNNDIAQALKTLQNAGIAVTLQPAGMPVQNYNSEMAQMSMLLGNNNGYQNRSLDMLPYMMMQSKNNPSQYNPQMVQAMMMNYMMPSFDFNSNNNNNY